MRVRVPLHRMLILTALVTLQMIAHGQWEYETVITGGTKCAIAVDTSGNPHISYRDGTIGWRLKYAHWDGTDWQIAEVETTKSVYGVTSIALDDSENPHIAFEKSIGTGGQLWHAWWNGSTWQQEGVDSLAWGDVGEWNSIIIAGDGYPHIAYKYYKDYTSYLKYAYKDASGWHRAVADSMPTDFNYISMALDGNNNPHISYYDGNVRDLKYAYWDGSNWQTETVDSIGKVGKFSSIALDSLDYPCIAYMDGTNYGVKYARWDGSSWQIETVESDIGYGFYTSLALDANDCPHISSAEYMSDLRFAYWDGSNWQIEVVDNTVGCDWTSLAINDSGYSHIAYYDADLGDLKYAKKSPTAAYSGPIWYISVTGSDETGDGSEENPFASIQYAINSAGHGDTVLVQPGAYYENINYNGKNVVLGSLFLTTLDTSYISQTVIDGESSGSVVTFENGEDSTAVLSGFTITNGSADRGGGIYCHNSSPSMENVTITGNKATDCGGGIMCNISSPNLKNATVSENSAEMGGGIFCAESSPSLTNVIVSGNSSLGHGGGIACHNNSNPDLVNVTISKNTSDWGGGIACWVSCNPILVNTILWNDWPEEIGFHNGPNSITIAYSDVQGGQDGIVSNDDGTVYWLDGNISADPIFCNPDSLNYYLADNSPCVGTGENGANIGALGVGCEAILSTDMNVLLPVEFALHQNYPNPFNSMTTISYELPQISDVTLKIYDITGRLIEAVVNEKQDPGYYSIQWVASDVSSGVYIYRIQADGFSAVKKCILMK
ncbi:MAG: T9SS type A sorting domain-containing protein [Candidatus Marinimicrobia bacterium]|nr:T9SS type A sorting domain-containing protein [Candidatus Neomarinimicrobiota bacterium]